MRDETITAFLDQLAARVPAPGGGATAALHAAQSAALLAMVARYSDAAKYDADLMSHVITEADGIRNDALTLAERDAAAFGGVAEAYALFWQNVIVAPDSADSGIATFAIMVMVESHATSQWSG